MEIISFSVLAAILIAYAIISTFIINSISASLEVNKLKNYSMTDKHYSDYGITESDLVYIRKVRAINYYILFNKNKQINDNKESYLYKSQNNIRKAIIVLLFIPLIFLINIALSDKIHFIYLNKLISWFN